MNAPFQSFVIIAEMRTGSNFLQANLNALDGVTCNGEAFNPNFIDKPNLDTFLGITKNERDANPSALLERMREENAVTGFRYFHDHDERVLDILLADPSCAKIILRRNPVDSYVSLKIAEATGQWMLVNRSNQKSAKILFDKDEFTEFLSKRRVFQTTVNQSLQESGQTAFHLRYEDLQSIEVLNGIAKYLGVPARLSKLDRRLKKQNPIPLSEKVANPEEMKEALSSIEWLDLDGETDLEPDRMPGAKTYVTASRAPLLFLPIGGGPTDAVKQWLADLDGVEPEDLPTNLSQQRLRRWKRTNPGHRSFTVVRHPVVRVHHVYCSYILGYGPVEYAAIRRNLSRQTDGKIPRERPDMDYDISAHREGLFAFVDFLKANLKAQTSARVDAVWCTQSQAISGFANFALPDVILREDELALELPTFAEKVGSAAKALTVAVPDKPFALRDVYDAELESKVMKAYQRDYMMFGFSAWA